jgi:hypothetical protein
MALSVVQRPEGFIIGPTSGTATHTKGSETVTSPSHGLSGGAYIYITEGEAIGFWRVVTPITANTFLIKEYAAADAYTFIKTGSFSYYKTLPGTGPSITHGWNAVHLPIIYKLSSNFWPTNGSSSTRTISSYTNDNGYVKITASGPISSDLSELEFVKITYVDGTSVVAQVITWYSTSIVTVNLAYAGGITFSTIQYYYNNYHARIKIYAGLSSSHYFGSQKPYTEIAELRVIPDQDNIITININEFLKEQIEILTNDLNKGTLQNNLDAFCQFYIAYAEGYDFTEGGYTLMDFVGNYTDDSTNFTGYAVNADLPFKSLNSGYLSDYIYGNSATKLKFLTPTLYPEITPGQFFDISFINQIGALLRIRREVLQAGTIVNTFIDPIDDYGVGIYRYEVDQSIYLEDQIYLTLEFFDYVNWIPISETKVITINNECSHLHDPINLSWLNHLGTFDYWAFKGDSNYGVDIETTKSAKKNIFTNWPKSFGAGADTISFQTSRESRVEITVRAENLSEDKINDLYRIRTSPLVQIVKSRTDRRTVIVDTGSFVYLQEGEKLFNLTFKISLTDNLPSQSL